jgi:hypothetical protein
MRARALAAGDGWQWIIDGFGLFRRQPFMWIALTFVLVALWIVSLRIQVLGPLLFNLLSPVFFAGLMIGCKAVDGGRELEFSHLFAGFQKNAAPLVTLGGVYLIGTIVIVGIILTTAGGSLPAILQKSPAELQQMDPEALRAVVLALMVGSALYIPLLMLLWFAPALVVFHDLSPVQAMILSFSGCVMNWLTFLVYGAIVLVLWFIASMPMFLGLVILLPVLICSVYASYKMIFAASGTAPGGSGSPYSGR